MTSAGRTVARRVSRAPSGTFALFRVAAGPRLGHGHLRRAETLAEALARPVCVSLRGAGAPTSLPVLPACTPDRALDETGAAVLVLDDPRAFDGLAWCRAARRRGVPVVSVHDLGLARVPSTLAVDGSVVHPRGRWPADGVLCGLPYAVLRPPRRNRRAGDVRRVLISLGGGPRRGLVHAIAGELSRRMPGLEIVVPASSRDARTRATSPRHAAAAPRVRMVSAPAGLASLLARVDVAILAGGMSLYEAVAAGAPAIAIAVAPAQQRTIAGFAALGLVRQAGAAHASRPRTIACAIADELERLAADAAWRRHIRREGPRVVDGRGARRVAQAIVAVAERGRE